MKLKRAKSPYNKYPMFSIRSCLSTISILGRIGIKRPLRGLCIWIIKNKMEIAPT